MNVVFTRDEEGVVCIASRMLLWLEKGVEVPEATFNEVVGRHFAESVINI